MRSGFSERILSIFADVKGADAWFLAAGLWRPDEPEMRPCSRAGKASNGLFGEENNSPGRKHPIFPIRLR